jgi:hypothetical protein
MLHKGLAKIQHPLIIFTSSNLLTAPDKVHPLILTGHPLQLTPEALI